MNVLFSYITFLFFLFPLGLTAGSSIEVERLILLSNANLAVNESPQDLLYKGIVNDSPEEIRNAFQNGANINKDQKGDSLLLKAVLLRKSNAVSELINLGADLKITYARFNLVQHALKGQDVKSAFYLVKAGAEYSGAIDDIGRNAMDYAINILENPQYPLTRTDVLELIQEFINHGYNIHNSHWRTNVWYATIDHPGRTEDALNLFIKNGADPNQIIDTSQLILKSNWTPLMRAISFNNTFAAKIILDAGANINQKANPYPHIGGPYTPLTFAITFGYTDMVKFLLENGADL